MNNKITVKALKLFTRRAIVLCLIQACSDKTETKVETVTSRKEINEIETEPRLRGGLGSYDVLESGEIINQVYGKKKIRDGHWITFGMSIQKKKQSGEHPEKKDNMISRIKREEGYYRHNKKEGFWKFYNDDGTLKDSVEYKNDTPVIKPS